MNSNVVGLDIAKSIFHLYSLSAESKAVKKKLKRMEMLAYFANLPASLIGIEACGGAHYWARELTKLGHEVVLLNARFVKGFVIGNKNDFNDAEAIFTAVTRPNKRTVAVKDDAQQDNADAASLASGTGGRAYGAGQPDSWLSVRTRDGVGEECQRGEKGIASDFGGYR